MQMVESRSLTLSVFLHIAVVLIAAFGLPILLPKKPDPVPMVLSVELLPISQISNVKPSDKPIEKEQKNAPVKQTKPMPPLVKEPPKPVPTPPTPPKPVEKTFDPDEGAKPKDKIKPVEKPKEEPDNKEFQDLLKNLKQQAEKEKTEPVKDAKDKENKQQNLTKSDAPYDDSAPLSISEKDMIRSQFIPCWAMPAGAKDAANLAVKVKVTLQQDGTVLTAAVAPDQMGRYSSDTFFRAAADSAVRAVHKCSPLKNLPSDKYGSWREMELNFDPRELQ